MEHDTEQKPGPEERDPQPWPDQSRRRMLRRSLTVAMPVVATLASRPVSAGDCLSASAFWSGNASRTPMNACAGGRSPSAWIALPDASWPAGVTKGSANSGTKFNAIFGTNLAVGNPSLLTVLGTYDSTPANAVQQAGAVTAVWLNARAGLTGTIFTPGVTPTEGTVLEIWESIVANGGSYRISATKALASPQATHNWLALTW